MSKIMGILGIIIKPKAHMIGSSSIKKINDCAIEILKLKNDLKKPIKKLDFILIFNKH